VELLPTGMDPSIHSDVFAGYKRGALEMEHRVDDVRNFTHPCERMKLRQRIVIVVCMQWSVHISRLVKQSTLITFFAVRRPPHIEGK
jgi:hypothetical protein